MHQESNVQVYHPKNEAGFREVMPALLRPVEGTSSARSFRCERLHSGNRFFHRVCTGSGEIEHETDRNAGGQIYLDS